jgi:hypothetical protein
MTKKILSNKKLAQIISIISILLILRLIYAAYTFGNWRGFFYSSLHVVAVAIFAYLATRSSNSTNK